jgi:hypothetical protein
VVSSRQVACLDISDVNKLDHLWCPVYFDLGAHQHLGGGCEDGKHSMTILLPYSILVSVEKLSINTWLSDMNYKLCKVRIKDNVKGEHHETISLHGRETTYSGL